MSRAGRREVRDLRRQAREWRRGRADTTLGQVLSDAYIAVLAVCMLTAMAVSAVRETRVSIAASCTSASCSDARFTSAWIAVAAALALTLAAARTVGPVQVSPAEGSWLLSAPVDRAALLRPRFALAVAVAAVGSAAAGALGSALAGFSPTTTGLVALATGAGGSLAVAAATRAQSHRGTPVRLLSWALGAATWLALVLVAVDLVPPAPTGSVLGRAPRLAVVVALWIVAIGALVAVGRTLSRLRHDRLVPGGMLLANVSGALSGLDLAMTYDVLVAQRWQARATVRPVRGGPSGRWALVWRDVVRLRRSTGPLLLLVAAAVVPYLARAVDLGPLVVLVAASALFVAGLPLCSALRTTSRNPGLLRCFPMAPQTARLACLAVPAVLAAAWSGATVPAVHASTSTSWPVATLLAAAVAGAAIAATARWLLAPPPSYSQTLVSTPAGAVPPGLTTSLFRGLDVLVLAIAPVLISRTAPAAVISLVLSAAVLAWVVRRD